VLRSSEVLSNLKIIINDRTAYTGRAVVSNLITTGTGLVCEAKLDESVSSQGFLAGARSNGSFPTRFREFLEQWQKLYRILPDYKVVLADMQTFLSDLRLWLEEVELGIRSMSPGDRSQTERDITQQLAPLIVPAITNLFGRFEEISERLDTDQVPAHWAFGQRQLHPLLLCSPFVYRTYAKPLGYAGDYEMVNMMFRDPFEGGSLFAKMINSYALQLPPIIGHRNRIVMLTERLSDEARRLARLNRPLRVFSLGCGPAQEIQRFMINDAISDHSAFTLADFNDETLEHTRGVLQELKRRYGRTTQLNFVRKSVHQLLKHAERRAKHPVGESYELLYCAGLFDYVSDAVSRKLMEIFFDMLSPGGLLIATNVDVHPARCEMECFLEWHLVHRNTQQLRALSPHRALVDDVVITRDPSGVNAFIEIRKSE
jgi:extracellular factor (EF) 3-hydroxypalmitic acid methyl ester biosynthesis protein